MTKKQKEEKIDPFNVKWADEVEIAIEAAREVFNNALKEGGFQSESRLRKGKSQLTKANKIINQVWHALREIQEGKRDCLNKFGKWKTEKAVQALCFMNKKLEKEYLPMFEVMAIGDIIQT
jgi:hypothetical protein